jgi:predicted LPLAT superfamily acyltransferase
VQAHTGVSLVPGVLPPFALFAESILDKMLLWGGLFNLGQRELHGATLMLDDRAAARRGCLLICAHLGNLDLCRVLSRQRRGLKLTVLVHTATPSLQRHAGQARSAQPAEPDAGDRDDAGHRDAAVGARGAWRVRRHRRRPRAGVAAGNPRVAMAPFLGAQAPSRSAPMCWPACCNARCTHVPIREGDALAVYFEPSATRCAAAQGRASRVGRAGRDYAKRLEHSLPARAAAVV